jgi:hypothetical protein
MNRDSIPNRDKKSLSSPFYGTVMVETVGFCKIMAHIYQTTRYYVQEDNQLSVVLCVSRKLELHAG